MSVSERVLTIDSRDAPDGDMVGYWRRSLTNSDGVDLLSYEKLFTGRMKRLSLGDCTIFDIHAETPHRMRRAKRPDMCVANIYLEVGGATFRGQHEYRLRAGELTLYDSYSDYELDFSSGHRVLALVVPRVRLEASVNNLSSLFGRDLHFDRQVVEALSSLCQQLLASRTALSPAVDDNLAGSVTSLLGAALQDASESLPQASSWTQKALLQRVKAFVRENLDEPDLSPGVVAKAIGISVGYLHRLFQLEGSSVMKFILSERLERARIRLRRSDESISQIAFGIGFNASAHFSRAFREKFGLSPRDYKREVMVSHQGKAHQV